MGKELDALKRLIKAVPIAARDGLIEAAKTSAKAKFGLTFLKKIHDAVRDVPEKEMETALAEVQGASDEQIAHAIADATAEIKDKQQEHAVLLRAIIRLLEQQGGTFTPTEKMVEVLCRDIRDHLTDIKQDTGRTRELVEQMAEQPLSEAQAYERDYCEAVAKTLDEMELFGIDPRIRSEARKQKLMVAYLSLNLTDEHGRDQGLESFEELLEGMDPAKRNKVLVRGDAGSGKSTLLKWAAINALPAMREIVDGFAGMGRRSRGLPVDEGSAAGGGDWEVERGFLSRAAPLRLTSPLESWWVRVPFFIALRKCTDGKFPVCADFPAMVNGSLRKPPSGWVESILKYGRGLVLIDGVDEVPPKWRKRIYKGIDDFLKLYKDKGNLFVVSSRPLADDPPWVKEMKFREARIAPMSASDRNELIYRWHEAVAGQLSELGLSKEAADTPAKGELLKEDLARNPRVAQVATNPLMCAMLCALCGQLEYKLPDSQYEIVDQLCKVLLHSREEYTPDLDTEEFPQPYRSLGYPQRRKILSLLAYDMVLGGLSTVPHESLVAKVADLFEGDSEREANDASIVANTLIERSGVLERFSDDETGLVEIDFVHNTFKEFLASRRFIAEGKHDVLAKRCLQPGYANVCMFAAADHDNERFVDSLVEGVLPPEGDSGARRKESKSIDKDEYARNLLAVRMREVAIHLDPKLKKRIDKLRKDMFPPKTLADAEALAMLGDDVVDDLAYRSCLGLRQKVRCVRALRLIGSSYAAGELKRYARETKEDENALLGELAQAMDPLEIPEVLHRVTGLTPEGGRSSSNKRLSRRIRNQIQDLSSLAAHAGVVLLDLGHTPTTTVDLVHLSTLTNLQSLRLGNTGIGDEGLSHLSKLTSLQSLDLGYTGVADVGLVHLSALISLRSLNLEGTGVTDAGLPSLSALPNLQSLSLGNTGVTDKGLSYFPALTNLQLLDLRGTGVTSAGLSHLSVLTNLQSLSLGHTGVADAGLSHLSALTNLQSLDLRSTGVTDMGLPHLSVLTNLQSLGLGNAGVADVGLSHLSALIDLQSLDLRGTGVTDVGLSYLSALISLRSLNLGVTGITSAGLSHLSALTNLQSLDLRGTGVTDVGLSHLSALANLRSLNLSVTGVTKAGLEKLKDALPGCRVHI